MNFELHIASPSVPPAVLEKNRKDDVSGSRSKISSDFSGLSLLARIWMWLSQIWSRESHGAAAETVFHLGAEDRLNGHALQNLISAEDLNCYRRRMLARYTRLGLSLSQVKAWIKARNKAKRFQTDLARYYGLRFFRRAALTLSSTAQHGFSEGNICNAPLTPD